MKQLLLLLLARFRRKQSFGLWFVTCIFLAQASDRLSNLMAQTKAEEQLCTENGGASRLNRSQPLALALLRGTVQVSLHVGLNFSLTRALRLELSSQILTCELCLRYPLSFRTSCSLEPRHCPAQSAGCCECLLKRLLRPLLRIKSNTFN